jgi:hypothetical protein
MVKCVLILSILPFSAAQHSNTRPKQVRYITGFIKEYGTKTPSTVWCVEIKPDIQSPTVAHAVTAFDYGDMDLHRQFLMDSYARCCLSFIAVRIVVV